MHKLTLSMRLARFGLSCLVVLAASARAQTPPGQPALPEGWQALALPTVAGNFRQAGSDDIAMLVKSRDSATYGLAVVPASGGAQASIVKTFSDIKANPPQLSLVKPGNYQPVCHSGGNCTPQTIAHEAMSLCFGEASCQIIYFTGGSFRELAVSD